MSNNEEFVHRAYDIAEQKDIAGWIDCFNPDGRFTDNSVRPVIEGRSPASLIGDGIRLYGSPGGDPIRLDRVGDGEATSAVNVRYRPIRTANIAPEKVSR